MDELRTLGLPRTVDGIPVAQFALRLAWVAARIILATYAGYGGVQFFYQGF